MNAPVICDPFWTITAAAFLALSVFVGGVAAIALTEKVRAFRAARLDARARQIKGEAR